MLKEIPENEKKDSTVSESLREQVSGSGKYSLNKMEGTPANRVIVEALEKSAKVTAETAEERGDDKTATNNTWLAKQYRKTLKKWDDRDR